MTEPPFYQKPVMHSIESTVLAVREEFTNLLDADVEFAYDQLANYYKAVAAGKEVEEPLGRSCDLSPFCEI